MQIRMVMSDFIKADQPTAFSPQICEADSWFPVNWNLVLRAILWACPTSQAVSLLRFDREPSRVFKFLRRKSQKKWISRDLFSSEEIRMSKNILLWAIRCCYSIPTFMSQAQLDNEFYSFWVSKMFSEGIQSYFWTFQKNCPFFQILRKSFIIIDLPWWELNLIRISIQNWEHSQFNNCRMRLMPILNKIPQSISIEWCEVMQTYDWIGCAMNSKTIYEIKSKLNPIQFFENHIIVRIHFDAGTFSKR